MTPPSNHAPGTTHPNTAVVLSGGGANGAYEVGVLKALLRGQSPATRFKPLDPEIFSGTSIGAFNATVLASRMPAEGSRTIDHLEDIWLNLIPQFENTGHNHVFRFRGDPLPF